MKIVPLEYTTMGAGEAAPSWSALAPGEAGEPADLRDQIERLQGEKVELLGSIARQVAAARAEAYEAGRREQGDKQEQRTEQAAASLAAAIEGFSAARDRYFAEVEGEVVRLALAIAARVLHRESQMDPLLLSGAVRVALGQLSEATEVRLRVPAGEAELWTGMLRLMPHLPLQAAIVADGQLEPGDCRLETHLGSVDLGVRAQLAEIEHGFFDLLEKRGKDLRVKPDHAATA